MKIDPNEPAFGISAVPGEHAAAHGLTKREYIAAKLMAGLLASPDYANSAWKVMAEQAVAGADVLIRELNKDQPNG